MKRSIQPRVPDVPYAVALDRRCVRHAVSHAVAVAAYGQVEAAARNGAKRQDWRVRSVCGEVGNLGTVWGGFERGNPRVDGDRCPWCSWMVAIEQDVVQAELEALAPTPGEREVHVRLGLDPYLLTRICEAILADENWEREHPHLAHLLGHVSAHAPMILLPEECSENSCEHPRAAGEGGCAMPVAAIACGACSAFAGSYAGEWEGQVAVRVTAPCSVLLAFAEEYDVPLGERA